MAKYRYFLKADQHTNGYGGKWLNLDVPMEVTASDYEEASEKARGSLNSARTDTKGWRFFVTKVTEIEEEVPPQPEPTIIYRRYFRKKGIA